MQAVTVHGLKWAAVAAQVPGRSDMQCRERWMGTLDPARKSGAWTQVLAYCWLIRDVCGLVSMLLAPQTGSAWLLARVPDRQWSPGMHDWPVAAMMGQTL